MTTISNPDEGMKNENPYYLGNRDYPPTVLILQVGKETITQELPWDVAGINLTEAFYVALTHTFCEKDILSVMSTVDDAQLNKINLPHILDDTSLTIKTGNKTTRIDCGAYVDVITLIRAYITATVSIGFSRDGIFEDLRGFAQARLEELDIIKPKEDVEE